MGSRSIYHFHKLQSRYRRVQHRLFEATDKFILKRLKRKLNLLARRLLRLNRRWKLGIATATLLAWLAGSVQGQNFPASINLADLDGTNGFVIKGINEGDVSGASVSGAGDINGDGIDDVIIGARFAAPDGKAEAGESYVVFGSSTRNDSSLNLSALDGINGFVIKGINEYTYTGFSVSGAGDVNGDGIDDIVIGAPQADPDSSYGAGESYVIFGHTNVFGSSLDLTSLNGTNGFVIKGSEEGDYSGYSVSGAGDVNGDGVDDLIIGAFGAEPFGISYAGESYVVFGDSTGFGNSLALSTLDGTNGFVLRGIDEDDFSGGSVSGAGDINNDGIDDLIIGAPGADPDSVDFAGECYVVFGKNTGFVSSLDLITLDGTNGFLLKGIDEDDFSARSVSGAGDINGDGIDDLTIGAAQAGPNGKNYAGEAYVVFGRSTGFASSLDLDTLDGSNGFVINGIDENDESGYSVSGAGDINGDGIDDLVLSAIRASINGNRYSGETYVVFGNSAGFNSSLDLSALDGNNGFVIYGIDEDDFSGVSVSGAGDVNGDGINDLIIGAPGADVDSSLSAGETYVVFGRRSSMDIAGTTTTLPLRISPNPTSESLHLSSDNFKKTNEIEIALFDPLGRAVSVPHTRESSDRFRLDLHTLPDGVYLLQVVADGRMGTKRVVKR